MKDYNGKHPLCVMVKTTLLEKFEQMYGKRVTQEFCRRAIEYACLKQENFERIFWNEFDRLPEKRLY